MHTTNYVNTFIAVADDCPLDKGVVPPAKEENPSIASRTYQLIAHEPYTYSSDDVIFTVYADRAGIAERDRIQAREEFFSKGRPCLRASDLGKKYGWGVHANESGHIALYAVDSTEYAELVTGGPFQTAMLQSLGSVTVIKAMRSSSSWSSRTRASIARPPHSTPPPGTVQTGLF